MFVVPLDEERCWYRYHHLFAVLLHQRLRQTQANKLPALHLQSSEWYEYNEVADQAIEHALRAEDLERAAHLIEEHFDAMYQRGEHNISRRWLAELPFEVKNHYGLANNSPYFLFKSLQLTL